MEATRVRTIIGPNLEWFQDYQRYYFLFVQTTDGSLARRFAFLTMLLCLFTVLFVFLRRKRIPGVAAGPSWRLMGIVFGTMFFMMFNPTKWTHHFGAYAGIAGSLAALTAVVVSASALRSRRNRTMFLAGLLFVLALSFSGINGYWYVSSYGVPWFDKTVQLSGRESSTLFLVLFGLSVALVAWQYLREGYAPPPAKPGTAKGRRIRKFAAAPLTVVAGAMVLFEVLSMLKGAVSQYPAYSLGRSNVEALAGKTCGLAEDVLVESDPNDGALTPIADPANPLADPSDPLAGSKPVGFTPNGVPDDLTADYVEVKAGMGNTDGQSIGPSFETGSGSGTTGGVGALGVNGSTVKLPFGLDPARTPVLGSYQDGIQQSASVVSSWYQLPERSDDSPLVVLSAAGRIFSVDQISGQTNYGQSLVVEYGKRQADGTVDVQGTYVPRDIGPPRRGATCASRSTNCPPTPTSCGSTPATPTSPATSGSHSRRPASRSSNRSAPSSATNDPYCWTGPSDCSSRANARSTTSTASPRCPSTGSCRTGPSRSAPPTPGSPSRTAAPSAGPKCSPAPPPSRPT